MKYVMEKPITSYTKAIIFYVAIIIICCMNISNVGAVSKARALLVFGDSLVDTGNNNHIITPGKADFKPYGRDFINGTATGRFSNGKTPSDLIAEKMGIKELLPPYLDPNLTIDDLLTGVSFASGGSGYDPDTAKSVELYDLGARKIGVIGLPPCGCVPLQRTIYGGSSRNCEDEENQSSIGYNNKLISNLNSLNQNLIGSTLVYLDIYNNALDILNNPSKYGFEVVNKGCCGTGNFEVTYLCNELEINTCKDASKYIFWDSYHPTEKTYRIIVHDIVQKNPILFA